MEGGIPFAIPQSCQTGGEILRIAPLPPENNQARLKSSDWPSPADWSTLLSYHIRLFPA